MCPFRMKIKLYYCRTIRYIFIRRVDGPMEEGKFNDSLFDVVIHIMCAILLLSPLITLYIINKLL